jgi:hypothetical protein
MYTKTCFSFFATFGALFLIVLQGRKRRRYVLESVCFGYPAIDQEWDQQRMMFRDWNGMAPEMG